MTRDWNKYINHQYGQECLVVTALNAYYYLTGKSIRSPSREYDSLRSIGRANFGAATSIDAVHKTLGIQVIRKGWGISAFFKDKKNLIEGEILLPLAVDVWHKHLGYHSCLIVDQDLKTDSIRVTNFKPVTSTKGWMFREDFSLYEVGFDSVRRDSYKLFGLTSSHRSKKGK